MPGLRKLILFPVLCALFEVRNAASASAVGYINVGILPGFNLVSTPLYNPQQTVGRLVENVAGGIVPDGFTVYLPYPGGYRTATYDALSGRFEPAEVAAELLSPGRGFFLYNPTRTNLTVTFAGEVLQGTLTNALPAGFSLTGSMVPQAATLEVLGFPAEAGDVVYRFDPVLQRFVTATFDDLENAWMPAMPEIRVGEAFIVFKQRPANWVRTFFANP